MGKRRKHKKRKAGASKGPTSCGVCGAELDGELRCGRCGSAHVALPADEDGFALRVRGVLRYGDGLELCLEGDRRVELRLDEQVEVLRPPFSSRSVALVGGNALEVLGRVEHRFDDEEEGFRVAAHEHVVMEAELITAGESRAELMDRAIAKIGAGERLAQADLLPEHRIRAHESYEEVYEELGGGGRRLVLRRASVSSFERMEHSPKWIVPIIVGVALVMLAKHAGWPFILPALSIFILAFYVCLLDYNRIVFTVDRDGLKKSYHPFGRPGGWSIQREELLGLETVDVPFRSYSSISYYWLSALRRGGKRRLLVGDTRWKEVDYLSGAIERGLLETETRRQAS